MSVFSGTRGQFRTQGPRSVAAQAAKTDSKNAVVITLDELHRIKNQCSLKQDGDVERRHQDKQELYQKSQARVKNWPNTIQATRKKKDEERIKKLEAEEIERRKIDAEEEQLQI